MKKLFVFVLLISVFATASYAVELSPQDALVRALSSSCQRVSSQNAGDYELKYSNGKAVYVFSNSRGGYMAVSGNDIAPAVLGFSDSGVFTPYDMPPALEWWLDEYARQINTAVENGYSPSYISGGSHAERNAIGPLLTTKWNQTDPYNRACPTDSKGNRCLTGCVATAMAQIMNYHEWPERGSGMIDYKTKTRGYQVSVDLSTVTFDWANMADDYTPESSDESCDAVAQLMFAAGASVKMDYKTTESGAPVEYIPDALVGNFNYDIGVHCLYAGYFSRPEWEEVLYRELTENGPVVYSGNPRDNSNDGHAFVCDGYLSDGYFHFNWGWGGNYDGFYLPMALDPVALDYTSGQRIIAGISKPKEGSKKFICLYNDWNFRIEDMTEMRDGFRTVTFGGTFINRSKVNYTGSIGVRLVHSDGQEYVFLRENKCDLSYLGSILALKVDIDMAIPDGSYTVVPVFEDNYGNFVDIKTIRGYTGKLKMVKTGNDMDFSTIALSAHVDEVSLESPLYIDCGFKLSATIANTGTSSVYVRTSPVFVNSDGKITGKGDTYYAIEKTLDVGESIPVVLESDLISANTYGSFNPGSYTMYFVDADKLETGVTLTDDDYYSEGIPVTVKAKPQGSNVYTIRNFKVENEDNVDPENFLLTWNLTSNKGYFCRKLSAEIYEAYGTFVKRVMTDRYYVDQGKTESISFRIPFDEGEPGKRYWVALLDRETNEWKTDQYYFTVYDPMGVKTVSSYASPNVSPRLTEGILNVMGENIMEVCIYDIAGAKKLQVSGNSGTIDISNFPSGIYIVEILDAFKRTAVKVLKR